MVPQGRENIKDRAHELSSFANNAYQILNNEIERAEYLIKLQKYQITDIEQNMESVAHEEVILLDPELVERIFELRFTIAESESLEEL